MKLKILARTGLLIHGKGYFEYGDIVEFADDEGQARLEEEPHTYAKVVDGQAPKPLYLPKKVEE